MKKIGIIGGMGPLATVDLFSKIIKYSSASCDNEHIPIIIDNNTKIPDRTKAILHGGEDPVKEMVASAKTLEKSGADFLIMSCNTAHYFYEKVKKEVNIPFLNMIEETAKYILKKDPTAKKVGLLSTTGTSKGKIYENIFEKFNLEIVLPSEEEREEIMHLIYGVIKKGDFDYNPIKTENIIKNLQLKGASNIILGCTELPIAMEMFNIKGVFYDPTEILALSAIENSKN